MTDYRTTYRGNLKHLLTDMIFLVISAVICGADDWIKIELFGKSQITWLRKFAPFAKGIPSHDTLGRVFSVIDYQEFGKCFMEWGNTMSELTSGEVVAIDGKRIRGSYDTASGLNAIHMVSAFASENRICLGQFSCQEKSNEITAIPKLLELLAIKDCTVTIDAMGCQTAIAEKIREKGADYILAVKENQKGLYMQVEKMFEIAQPISVDVDLDSGHGRIETRKCTVIDDLKFLDIEDKWKDLKTIIKVESERFIKSESKTQSQTRFYISNLAANAKSVNHKIRSHWAIENNLHWNLDVVFSEDGSRKRKGDSAKNFNIISKIALTFISKENTEKMSSKSKRFQAALDTRFREKILRI
jgi:predicted transposase YbfD/YdcC